MSACIIWPGAKNSGGYPITWANNTTVYVHRQIMGAQKGECVLHYCDNPGCINPEHLGIGTHKDNSMDMVAKGRQTKGVDSHLATLSEKQVRDLRALKGFMSSRKAGEIFGCSKTNVLDIWNNKTWKHLDK